jgi:pyruvate dehydrogenase E1 component beta subunit
VSAVTAPPPGTADAGPRTVTFREATKLAIREALQRDERVFLMGEDVGAYGGCFAVTMGLLDEFGPERVRDTPLSESVFVGAGIGAAMNGLRPIVEIMTCNFSLLALDQIVNNAATLLHMSGGQFSVPLVIRTTAGSGRQLAAQHSHSFEPIYAHIPGIKVVSIATVDDARHVLGLALLDPDPVVIFEYPALYNVEGVVSESVNVDLAHAAIRRQGSDLTLITYGAMLHRAMEAAETLAGDGIDVEVIDLRMLRPLDMVTVMASVTRTHRALVAEEAWRTGGIGAEIAARIGEQAFWDLDAPVARVGGVEVPTPYAKHLEEAAVPQVETIVAAARVAVGRDG